MSKYTTELRYICEEYSGFKNSKGYRDVNDIITEAIPKVFDFEFPIFDEEYKSVLERKILKHYYTREISEETVGLWKLRLNTKMNEIMPYYNKLYESELLAFNPLYTVDLTRTRNGETNTEKNENESITDEATATETIGKTLSETSTNATEDSGSDVKTVNATKNVELGGSDVVTIAGTGEIVSEGTSGDTHSDTVSETKSQTDKYSDTPQGTISNLQNDTYLTNARIIGDSVSKTTSGSVDVTTQSTVNNSENKTDTTAFGKTEETVEESTNSTRYGKSVNESGSKSGTESVSASKNNDYSRTKSNNDVANTTEEYLERVSGYEGKSGSELLLKYRETFLNIDMQIINELEPLFFQLW